MTPPTVELQSKEANQDIKVMFPHMPVVEQQKRSKKYGFIALAIVGAAVVITAGALGAVALHRHLTPHEKEYNTETLYQGQHIPEHATIDYINRITYVNNSRYGEVLAGNNLHDYIQKLLVFKDIANKVCYIDTLDGTFEEGVQRLTQKRVTIPTPVKQVIASVNPIEESVLRKFAGDHIANHCQGLPTHWVIAANGDENTPTKEVTIDCTNADSNVLCREKRRAAIAVMAVMACHKVIVVIIIRRK